MNEIKKVYIVYRGVTIDSIWGDKEKAKKRLTDIKKQISDKSFYGIDWQTDQWLDWQMIEHDFEKVKVKKIY
ncbi:MAG: hypothetical protein ACP6IQ_02570 [Candidatus Njordarchaeia archaeon]